MCTVIGRNSAIIITQETANQGARQVMPNVLFERRNTAERYFSTVYCVIYMIADRTLFWYATPHSAAGASSSFTLGH